MVYVILYVFSTFLFTYNTSIQPSLFKNRTSIPIDIMLFMYEDRFILMYVMSINFRKKF